MNIPALARAFNGRHRAAVGEGKAGAKGPSVPRSVRLAVGTATPAAHGATPVARGTISRRSGP